LYDRVEKSLTVGTKRVSLEQLGKVLGLETLKDEEGNTSKEAPLPASLGKLSSKGAGDRDRGDHQEDGLAR